MAITRTNIAAEVPAHLMLAALDENHDGAEDSGILDQLIANAVIEAGNVDAAVLVLVCEAVLRRAGVEDAKNPFAERARSIRSGTGSLAAGGQIEYDAPDATHTMEQLDPL
jgi:hypothetical protein